METSHVSPDLADEISEAETLSESHPIAGAVAEYMLIVSAFLRKLGIFDYSLLPTNRTQKCLINIWHAVWSQIGFLNFVDTISDGGQIGFMNVAENMKPLKKKKTLQLGCLNIAQNVHLQATFLGMNFAGKASMQLVCGVGTNSAQDVKMQVCTLGYQEADRVREQTMFFGLQKAGDVTWHQNQLFWCQKQGRSPNQKNWSPSQFLGIQFVDPAPWIRPSQVKGRTYVLPTNNISS